MFRLSAMVDYTQNSIDSFSLLTFDEKMRAKESRIFTSANYLIFQNTL